MFVAAILSVATSSHYAIADQVGTGSVSHMPMTIAYANPGGWLPVGKLRGVSFSEFLGLLAKGTVRVDLISNRVAASATKSGRALWSIPADDATVLNDQVAVLKRGRVSFVNASGKLISKVSLKGSEVNWSWIDESARFVLGVRGDTTNGNPVALVYTKIVNGTPANLSKAIDLGNVWEPKLISTPNGSLYFLEEVMTECYVPFRVKFGSLSLLPGSNPKREECIFEAAAYGNHLVGAVNQMVNSNNAGMRLVDFSTGKELYSGTQETFKGLVQVPGSESVFFWTVVKDRWFVFKINL